VPRDPELLLTLPGVGRYTAGAIASIAFGVRTPIVDTNIARVLMRLDARGGAAASPRTTAWLWDRATSMVTAARDPAALNEGLMELGALVCPAGEPRCPSCPLRSRCAAARQGIAAAIPALAAASPRRCIVHHAIVVLRGERVLLVQRGERGLWASMWQVPTVESGAALEPDALNAAAAPIRVTSPVEEFTHQTSHRSVQFRVHRGTLRIRKAVAGWRWVSASELPSVPLSNPMRRIVLAALGKQATAR
jgi:A/G-specific adenine glycosylase